jgi:hypothetical protein
MNARAQVTIDPDLQRRAQARAAELGISFAEYVRRLLAQDLGELRREVDISLVFDLVTDGPPTNVARDKDRMLAEAVCMSISEVPNASGAPGSASRPNGREHLRRFLGLVRGGSGQRQGQRSSEVYPAEYMEPRHYGPCSDRNVAPP